MNKTKIILVNSLCTNDEHKEGDSFNSEEIYGNGEANYEAINRSKNSIKKVYKESSLVVKNEIARKILGGKYTQRELAATFNVSKSVVGRVSKNAEMLLDIDNMMRVRRG